MGKSQSPRIEHVVVLMLENRSFDHMLGFLDHPDPAFEGLRPGSHHNADSQGNRIPATNDGAPWGLDPDHSHEGALRQLGSHGEVPHSGGFAWDYELWLENKRKGEKPPAWATTGARTDVMRCLDPPNRCPVLATLALEFAVCQKWFSSVPGETWPNRNFAHAATSDSTVNIELGFYWDPTIFELIAKRGATWHIYFDGPPQVWCYRRLWRNRTILDFLLRRRAKIGNWFEAGRFFDHVRDGKLPNYSFIEPAHNRYYSPPGQPRQTNSQHPGNNLVNDQDFYAGEQLVKDIYQALLDQPELFAKTLLLITYDEHGGLYDHAYGEMAVPPGDPVYRDVTRLLGRFFRGLADRRHKAERKKFYDFSGLGVRVPAVLVSPWIRSGTLVTKTLEHASIPRTLHDLFAPDMEFLTKRDAAAAGFHDVVTGSPLTRPRPNPRHPGPSDADHDDDDDDDEKLRPLPDLDQLLPDTASRAALRSTVAAAPGVDDTGADDVVFPEAPSPEEVTDADELDRQLVALTERVHRKLQRGPVTSVRARLSSRRAPAPEGEAPSDPRRARPDTRARAEASSGDLFSTAAEKARRPKLSRRGR